MFASVLYSSISLPAWSLHLKRLSLVFQEHRRYTQGRVSAKFRTDWMRIVFITRLRNLFYGRTMRLRNVASSNVIDCKTLITDVFFFFFCLLFRLSLLKFMKLAFYHERGLARNLGTRTTKAACHGRDAKTYSFCTRPAEDFASCSRLHVGYRNSYDPSPF